MKPDESLDKDLSVTRDPTPAPGNLAPGSSAAASPPASSSSPPPLPDMSDADETLDSDTGSSKQLKSLSSFPILPPPPADAPVVPGYHLLHKLGEGGMGMVWKAVQLATRREVALKLLSPAAFGSDTARLRFQREVELAARLEHPFIARVYDSTPDDKQEGLVYYAMELVPGQDLETFVRANALKPKAIIRLIRDVCLGVQHAHQRGVIHRDLKPSNILVLPPGGPEQPTSKPKGIEPDNVIPNQRSTKSSSLSHATSSGGGGEPAPKIVDFGLAKTTTPEDGQVTLSHVGQVAGTPAYMSPEQAAGRTDAIDTRTDVYALGVILYRLLTQKYPHDTAVSFADLLRHITEDDVVRPRAASEDASKLIDRELETLLLKALEKDPDRRYDNAGALATDLDNYLNNDPLNARPASVSYLVRKRIAKHRVVVGMATGLVLAGLLGTAWWYRTPVRMQVTSNPPGAHLIVNGVLREGCGTTPCYVTLGPGDHEIRLRHERGDYQEAVRHVSVAFGHATGDTREDINLRPAYQIVEVTSEPSAVPVEVIDADTGKPLKTFRTPYTAEFPLRRYRFVYHFPESQGGVVTDRVPISGSINLLRLHQDAPTIAAE